eukprot:CAMPEP_0202907724 /NCGR_PEP_ID=MMETSP1392-20130828/43625_1 /ASSEMBLY_ACC=CAM_ASM_000868 /TAXON_ID=225041 /ORGANISM="Chlamydomonas chlamydogama, Strain SAG 11-48b" /LENGTH=50 /DNA_ID=CAMNT_0049596751 /DNA_START=152 /DNA_END=304 /DNA_ORIENTATION=-
MPWCNHQVKTENQTDYHGSHLHSPPPRTNTPGPTAPAIRLMPPHRSALSS